MLIQKNMKGKPQKGSATPIGKEKTDQDCVTNFNISTISLDGMQCKGETRTYENRIEKLRLDIMFWHSLQKFVEISIIFLLTLLAIKWTPLRLFLTHSLCELIGYTFFTAMVLYGFYYIPGVRRSLGGYFIKKLLCLCYLTATFFLLAIQFPLLTDNFLHPYFALMAAGTAGISYLLLMLITVAMKPNTRGWGLYLSIIFVPTFVVAAIRPFYLYFDIGKAYDVDYYEFMRNIIIALVVCLLHTFEAVYVFDKFVISKEMESLCREAGLLPYSFSDEQSNSDVEKGICKF